VATLVNWGNIAALLFFLCLLMLSARLWAMLAVRRVSVTLKADSTRLFPGDTTTLRYRIRNDKLLPLIWVEIFQPLAKSLCLVPKDSDEIRPLSEYEKHEFQDTVYSEEQVAEKRFSMVMWHQTLTWKSKWKATCRGLYKVTRVRVRSGDGFGLCARRIPFEPQELPVFAVYPCVIPVNVSLFLRDQWDVQSGSRGYMEDVTVLRSTKTYQPGDPVKHINWRMVARQQPLAVNVYETIQPRSAHFVLDTESFNGVVPHEAELEETLNILCSVLLRLQDVSFPCGLSLPKTGRFAAANFFAKEKYPLPDLLYQLAAFRFCPLVNPAEKYDRNAVQTWEVIGGDDKPAYGVTFRSTEENRVNASELPDAVKATLQPYAAPSAFAQEELVAAEGEMGHVYYITYDLAALEEQTFLQHLNPHGVTILCYRLPEQVSHKWMDYHVLPLDHLKGGEPHAAS